jgi:S-DNA-T family DNA segregation ATPase FtsK/SpoIIIE
VQGVFIRDEEVNAICEYVKSQGTPQYDDSFVTLKDLSTQGKQVSPDKADPLYNEVKQFVISSKKASTSLIQRKFSIGYGRAARLIDMLEDNGIVGPSNGSKPRKILVQNTYDSDESSI